MTDLRPASVVLAASLALAGGAHAQTVTLQRIADQTTPVRACLHGPALEGGQVALQADGVASGLHGSWVSPAGSSGPCAKIVDELVPMPTAAGQTFRFLDNPDLDGVVVTFTAGYVLSHPANAGVYQGGGGTIVPAAPWGLLAAAAEAAGTSALQLAGGGGPSTVYAQGVVLDPSLPTGLAITDAVAPELLP